MLWLRLFLTAFLIFGLSCSNEPAPLKEFKIIGAPENDFLEPALRRVAKDKGFELKYVSHSPLDTLWQLKQGQNCYFDAVWPGSGLWTELGDESRVVKDQASILTSPLVFAVRKSLAESLGFVGVQIGANDLVRAVKEKKLSFLLPEPSQTTSGLCFYLALAKALGKGAKGELDKPALAAFFSGTERVSGSYLWLKSQMQDFAYSAMPLFEHDLVSLNLELEKKGREPLYALNLGDLQMLADSPLGLIEKSNPEKRELFLALKDYLLSQPVQNEILEQGRGASATQENFGPPAFANPSWGLDFQARRQKPDKQSQSGMVYALQNYEQELRKPSFTVYLLGFPASGRGQAERELKSAMRELLDPSVPSWQQRPNSRDRALVITYNDNVMGVYSAESLVDGQIKYLLTQIDMASSSGGGNIYPPLIEAARILGRINRDNYLTSIVLVASESAKDATGLNAFKQAFAGLGRNCPVFCVQAGNASVPQLDQVAEFTRGRIFDGRSNLAKTLRAVKSYN